MIQDDQGIWTLTFQKHPEANHSPIFYAIQSLHWPNGLVPIYQTKPKSNQRQFKRHLGHAKENFTDPLFFAISNPSEKSNSVISGRWACEAKHKDGSIDFLHWEITAIGSSIVGRFDQDTDYRFAWLSGGRFDASRFKLQVEYIDAKYELKGQLKKNQLFGTWRHTEDADGGTWSAEPAFEIQLPSSKFKTVALYTKVQSSPNLKPLHAGDSPGPDWQWLCNVWIPESSATSTSSSTASDRPN